jgi:hypothetical protein
LEENYEGDTMNAVAEEQSIAAGKMCIVKFHENKDTDNRNQIITRSLGKFGVIATAWYENKRDDEVPHAGEFWKVRILKEIGVGQRNGCFVLTPMNQVHVEDLEKLIPGMYEESFYNGIVIVTPSSGVLRAKGKTGGNFILPLAIRKKIKGVYAIIVDLVL